MQQWVWQQGKEVLFNLKMVVSFYCLNSFLKQRVKQKKIDD